MFTCHLDNVCIRTMPCSGCEIPMSPWGPWAGNRDEAVRPGWAGGVLVVARPLGTVPNLPISARRCCWRSCVSPGVRPTSPPSTSSTTCWPAPTVPCGELGGRDTAPSLGDLWGLPQGADVGVYPHRTELHFNHLAENNVFGIVPLSKVTVMRLGGGGRGSLPHSGAGGGRARLPHRWLLSLSTAGGKAEGDAAVQQAPGCHEGDGHLQRGAESLLAHLGGCLSSGGCWGHQR